MKYTVRLMVSIGRLRKNIHFKNHIQKIIFKKSVYEVVKISIDVLI